MTTTPIRAFAFLAALLSACGGAPQPEDMTAREHEEEAAEEEAAADEHERRYDPDARMTTGGQPSSPAFYGSDVYNPTTSHLAEAAEHREHAEAHRHAAAALRDYEEAECAQFPPQSRAACPLLLDLVSIENIDGGVLLRFADGADTDPVLAHLRCHLAYAAAAGREGIDSCALYVRGVAMEEIPEGVVLTTSEGDLVDELRRRAHVHAP